MRISLWSLLFLIVIFLVWQKVAPSGQITYHNDFFSRNDFIGPLTPKERVDFKKRGVQPIIGNPVYFALRPPRTFQTARVTVKFKNTEAHLSIMELGLLQDKTIWRYELKPLYNRTLEELSGSTGSPQAWSVIQEGQTMLLQRQKKYQSIEEFLKNPPEADKIAVYNYQLPKKWIPASAGMTDEQEKTIVLNQAVRGPFQLYTYVAAGENLDFNFTVIDENQNSDTDPIELNLYDQNDNFITQKILPDASTSFNDVQDKPLSTGSSIERTINFGRAGLTAGAYKIELKVNDDIVTKQIAAKQFYGFINRLWLASPEQTDLILYTNAPKISLQTINPASLQTALINGQRLELNQTYRQLSLASPKSSDEGGLSDSALVKEIKLQRGDVIISGNGVFSFSPDGLIDPNYRKVDADFVLDGSSTLTASRTDYIIANYQPVVTDGDWLKQTLEFDLTKAYLEKGRYSFLLSAPNLYYDDEVEDRIVLDDIKIELFGRTLLSKLREYYE